MPTVPVDEEPKASPAVFGIFDGLTSVLGVLVALAGQHPKVVLAAAVGLAITSTESMAAGEWLSSPDREIRPALIMGAATFVGTALPALGFIFLPAHAAFVVAAVVSVLLCAGIAGARSRYEPTLRSWVETFAIFGSGVAVIVAVTWLGWV